MDSVFDVQSRAIPAHAGQIDKGRGAYFRDLERVANAAYTRSMNRIDAEPMTVMIAEILHDALEDTLTMACDLKLVGVNGLAMFLLETKPKGKIACNSFGATLIPMSDNEDKPSPDRSLAEGEAMVAHSCRSLMPSAGWLPPSFNAVSACERDTVRPVTVMSCPARRATTPA